MKFILLFFIAFLPITLWAQTPDWSTSVAKIVYKHCTSCHHEGAIAPFSLMTYDNAINWSYSIQTQINAKAMPPWPPDPDYMHFKDENVLSEDELNTINSWIDNGMLMGDTTFAPSMPIYAPGALMQDPDETVLLPVFTLPNVGDCFWRFVNHSGYTQTKYLNSVEFFIGNGKIVHHATVSTDNTGLAWEDDLSYPGPGCPRGYGNAPAGAAFMSQSEGRVVTLPPNIGFEVNAGEDYVTDMHYNSTTPGAVDSSRINLKFCTVPDVRPVSTQKVLYGNEPSMIDGPLEIPPNVIKTFHMQSEVFDTDMSLLGIGPHAHQVCVSWLVYMVGPAGDTVNLISIPKWKFAWQGSYLLTKVLKIPAGYQVFGTVVYDNTSNNPDNPSNPPQYVYGNASVLGEMAIVHFWMMDYQPGDEDIILDSAFYGFPTGNQTIAAGQDLKVFPNPASQQLTVDFPGSEGKELQFNVYNHLGELLLTTSGKSEVNGTRQLDCSALPPGFYLLQAQGRTKISTTKFIIQR
jgi:hypothetical protein